MSPGATREVGPLCHYASDIHFFPLQIVSPPPHAMLKICGHKPHMWSLINDPLCLESLSWRQVFSLFRNLLCPPPLPL